MIADRRSAPFTILLVDDDDVDILIVRRALQKLEFEVKLVVASDGLEALEVLSGTTDRPALARPYLVLLDLNMPRMSGTEFLADIRADPNLRDTLIFVLTTSTDERDRRSAYQFNVAGYIVKSDATTGFDHAMDMICAFCQTVEFP